MARLAVRPGSTDQAAWEQTDSSDPRKMFAQEVFTTVKARVPKFVRNGSGNHSVEKQGNWIPLDRDEDEAQK